MAPRPTPLAAFLGAGLAVFQIVAAACAAPFPIAGSDDAIAMAQDICLKYGPPLLDEDMNRTAIRDAMPSFKWGARLEGSHWLVDTMPSVVAKTNAHLLVVDIPLNGPAPKRCIESGYVLIGLSPRPATAPTPRADCKPSDISGPDAQQLALEAVSPHGGMWLAASPAQSEPDAWIVSVRIPKRPASEASADKGMFKIMKRTANVINMKTGERFTSLPSKAQFVEHHCLDAQPSNERMDR